MKVCYVDDSGLQASDPCIVMVGILADAQRLHATKQEFDSIFKVIQKIPGNGRVRELKSTQIFYGGKQWYGVDADTRYDIIKMFCEWIVDRKHKVVFSAIDKQKHSSNIAGIPCVCDDEWLACALHIALQVQKCNQGKKNNKGHTFLIFDENKAKVDHLAELLWEPPEWTDDYYNLGKKQQRLDQLVDNAFFVKSHHSGLVQVADLYAFILRRYAELVDFGSQEKFQGELEVIKSYIQILNKQFCPKSTRWTKSKSECQQFYNEIAPASLLAL